MLGNILRVLFLEHISSIYVRKELYSQLLVQNYKIGYKNTAKILLQKVTGKEEAGNEILHLRRFPEPPEKQNNLAVLIGFMPVLWGMTVFMNLLHTGREIAAEKHTTKVNINV